VIKKPTKVTNNGTLHGGVISGPPRSVKSFGQHCCTYSSCARPLHRHSEWCRRKFCAAAHIVRCRIRNMHHHSLQRQTTTTLQFALLITVHVLLHRTAQKLTVYRIKMLHDSALRKITIYTNADSNRFQSANETCSRRQI